MLAGVHERITERALKKYFSPKALKVVKKANVGSDDLLYHLVSAIHCSSNNIKGNARLINNLQKHTEDVFIKAATAQNKTLKNNLIEEGNISLGMLFHAGQDQIAHTNEIDLLKLKNIDGKFFSNKNPFEPAKLEGIKSCNFRIWNELKCAVGKLFPNMYKDPQFYKNYLKADNPGQMIPHWEMNLDTEGTVHSLAYKTQHGISGFHTAFRLATIQTKTKWLQIQENFKKAINEETAADFLATLKTWNPSDKFLKKSFYPSRQKVEKKIKFFSSEYK